MCGFLFIYPEWDCRDSWFCRLMFPSDWCFISSGKISAIISSHIACIPFFFAVFLELQLSICLPFVCILCCLLSSPLCVCPFVSASFWKHLLIYLAVHLFSMYNLLLNIFSVFLVLSIFSVLEFFLICYFKSFVAEIFNIVLITYILEHSKYVLHIVFEKLLNNLRPNKEIFICVC